MDEALVFALKRKGDHTIKWKCYLSFFLLFFPLLIAGCSKNFIASLVGFFFWLFFVVVVVFNWPCSITEACYPNMWGNEGTSQGTDFAPGQFQGPKQIPQEDEVEKLSLVKNFNDQVCRRQEVSPWTTTARIHCLEALKITLCPCYQPTTCKHTWTSTIQTEECSATSKLKLFLKSIPQYFGPRSQKHYGLKWITAGRLVIWQRNKTIICMQLHRHIIVEALIYLEATCPKLWEGPSDSSSLSFLQNQPDSKTKKYKGDTSYGTHLCLASCLGYEFTSTTYL